MAAAPQKTFIPVFVTAAVILTASLIFLNRWINSKIDFNQTAGPQAERSLPVSKPVVEIARPPVINPNSDPLNPVYKKPGAVSYDKIDSRRIYQPSAGEILVQ